MKTKTKTKKPHIHHYIDLRYPKEVFYLNSKGNLINPPKNQDNGSPPPPGSSQPSSPSNLSSPSPPPRLSLSPPVCNDSNEKNSNDQIQSLSISSPNEKFLFNGNMSDSLGESDQDEFLDFEMNDFLK